MSEAEEVNGEDDEDDEDGDMTEEQRAVLNNRLLALRTKQSQEYYCFITRMESDGEARGRQGEEETPDDYKFGA